MRLKPRDAILGLDRLKKVGVTALRLSPHSCDTVKISRIFRDRLDAQDGASRIREACGDVSFSNGFLFGESGADMAEYAEI